MRSRDSAPPRVGARLRAGRRTAAAFAALSAVALAGCSNTSSRTQSVTISGAKNLVVYISVPPGSSTDAQTTDVIDAEKLAYRQHASEVTAYHLGMRAITKPKISAIARSAIENTHAIAYLGDITPGDSEQSVGITNAQDLLQVSPTDTALELTQRTPLIPSGPKHFYEATSAYGRTFARVVPNSLIEAKAQVAEIKQQGVTTLAVLHDTTIYGQAIARAVSTDAHADGISVTTTAGGANGVFYGGTSAAAAAKALAAAPASAKVFVPSALDSPAFAQAIGTRTGVFASFPGLYPSSQLPAAGQSFLTTFQSTYGHAPSAGAIYGYEAMSAVIDTIKQAGRNANNRATVVRIFQHISARANSVIGPYSIRNGDTSQTNFVFSKLTHGQLTPFAQVAG